jgi:hypothetical protein
MSSSGPWTAAWIAARQPASVCGASVAGITTEYVRGLRISTFSHSIWEPPEIATAPIFCSMLRIEESSLASVVRLTRPARADRPAEAHC